MTKEELKNVLKTGESISVEFKEAKQQLPDNLFETICAFLNTEGGKILLGVRDDGTISGVDPESINRLKKDIANISNNPKKLDPVFMLSAREIEYKNKIFRELVANIIAHREYLDGRPATIIIYKDKVVFSNPNIPNGRGVIDPKHFTPFSKNPTICKFMLQTGRIEEVGSGIRNVSKYLPLYSRRGKFEFIENDMFVTNVYLDELVGELTPQATQKTTQKSSQKIMELVYNDPQITIAQMSDVLNISDRAIKKNINKLKEQSLLKRIGPDKGGHWIIMKKKDEQISEKFKIKSSQKSSQESSHVSSQTSSQKILELIRNNAQITIEQMSKNLNISDRAVKKNIKKLKDQGFLERIGPDKGGYWKIIKTNNQD